MTSEMSQPRIVCAALRSKNGTVIIGIRHYDGWQRGHLTTLRNLSLWDADDRGTQGFVDQFGAFHTREEAWKIADAAGQVIRRCGGDTRDGGTLFSENLY